MKISENVLNLKSVKHRKEGSWIFAPIKDFLQFRNGYRCIGPCWWVITPENEAIFFESYNSPQCSSTWSVGNFLVKRSSMPHGSVLKFIKMAFIPD